MDYERLVDDGTVPFPYYTGLKEPNYAKQSFANLVAARTQYERQVADFELATGVEVIGERDGEIIIFLGNDPYTVRSKMEQFANWFNSEVYIIPDYKSGISQIWFEVEGVKIMAAKEAE